MKLMETHLDELLKSGEISHSPYFIKRYSTEHYLIIYQVMKEWIFEGIPQFISVKGLKERQSDYLLLTFIYSCNVLQRVLQSGQNDHQYNRRVLRKLLQGIELTSLVQRDSYYDYMNSGLGMSIGQSSEMLSLRGEEICKIVVSLSLILADHLAPDEYSHAAA